MTNFYNTTDLTHIREHYLQHGEGRMVCPYCKGGSSKEQCMTLYLGDDDALRATCHRFKCKVGTIIVMGARQSWHKTMAKPVKKEQMQAIVDHRNISVHQYNKLKKKYAGMAAGLPGDRYLKVSDNAYIYPMYDENYVLKGTVVRPYEPGSGPKALTYLSDPDYDGMSWYKTVEGLASPSVFVVEDCVSAYCGMRNTGKAFVSLNGTHLNDKRMVNLLLNKWQVVLMLDADATKKAIKYSRKYGPDSVRVLRLTKDVKDMTREELLDLCEKEKV